MERSERTIVRSFHAMAAARGIAERVERALARAAELEHLGAVWELDAERARERALAQEAAVARGEDAGPLAGTVCAWKDCFDVAGLHTTGGAPWRAGAPRATTSATIVQRLEAAGADHDRQARDDAAGLGDDGPDARPAALPQPARPRRASRAARRRARRWPLRPGSPTTRPAPTPAAACGIRPRPAASSASSPPTAPSRSTAACPTRRASTPAARSRAPSPRRRCSTRSSRPRRRPTSRGGLGGLRVAFLGGYFTAALEDDVAAMLERRARARARE